MPIVWIKQLTVLEQGEQHAQHPVDDGAERPSMGEATGAQRTVVRAAPGIPAHGAARPMVRGVTKSLVAGIPHHDRPTTATLSRHRGDAKPGARRVVRSVRQRLRSLSEHRGGDASPDPWHGADDSGVAVLALVASGGCLGAPDTGYETS